MSLAVKSVSSADDETQSLTTTAPVTSTAAGSGGVRHPVAVKVERHILGPRERPFLLRPPAAAVVEFSLGRPPTAAAAHDEEPHRRLFDGGAARPHAQPAIEPAQLLLEVAAHPPD